MTFGELPIGTPFKFRRGDQWLEAQKVSRQYAQLRHGKYPPTFVFADTPVQALVGLKRK